MALCAIQFRALEHRMFRLLLVQQIEDRSLHRVERNELQRLAVMHLADIDIVVEEERSRCFGRDLLVLETRL